MGDHCYTNYYDKVKEILTMGKITLLLAILVITMVCSAMAMRKERPRSRKEIVDLRREDLVERLGLSDALIDEERGYWGKGRDDLDRFLSGAGQNPNGLPRPSKKA